MEMDAFSYKRHDMASGSRGPMPFANALTTNGIAYDSKDYSYSDWAFAGLALGCIVSETPIENGRLQ